MDEGEWLASSDPVAMLEELKILCGLHGDLCVSSRRLRLFACACVRQVWHLLQDERSRRAVEVAERFADGEVASEELHEACADAADATRQASEVRLHKPANAATITAAPNAFRPTDVAVLIATTPKSRPIPEMQATQAALLREIVGNPLRPVSLKWDNGIAYVPPRDPAWPFQWHRCDWLTPTVLSLAQAAYDERPGRECWQPCPNCHEHPEERFCDVCGLNFGKGSRRIKCVGTGRTGRYRRVQCEACHETGRIEDGALDPLRLSILADALTDAGCDDDAILRHLRGYHPADWNKDGSVTGWLKEYRPHVRGCWVLDLLLGKEDKR